MPRLLTGLDFFSYNATKDLLCRSTIHFTLPYIFNRNTYNCQSQVARDRRRRSKLAKVSDVDRRNNIIPFTSKAHFRSHDVPWPWQGQTKSNEGFLGEGFPPYQLFSFSSDKDRRTDSRIRRKKHSAAPPGIEPRIICDFLLVSAGDGAVVRTLRTKHCLVTCDAVLIFFAVPKTKANYFF